MKRVRRRAACSLHSKSWRLPDEPRQAASANGYSMNDGPIVSEPPVRVTLNGEPLPAGVSPFDRGLHFGDGLFETIACRKGKARFLSLHLERLMLGCERLRINLGGVEPLRREVRALASA